MKHFIALFLGLMLIAGVAQANQFGFELQKAVNDGYQLGFPVKIDTHASLPFMPSVYLTANPIFTAPRGDIGQAFKSLNHSRFDMLVGGGITVLGCNLELGTGATYWWAQNNEGVPEGWQWNNYLKGYWNW